MKRALIRTEPPKQPHCSACLKTIAWLQQVAERYECSRVDCPTRKGVTAAPCSKPTHVNGDEP